MQAIQAPIKPGQSGPEVVNLQDALFALLERDVIRPHGAPDRPTPEALVKLTEGLKQERVESLFGASTGQFVMDFQIQQGLGDHLRDVGVEDKIKVARLKYFLLAVDLKGMARRRHGSCLR